MMQANKKPLPVGSEPETANEGCTHAPNITHI